MGEHDNDPYPQIPSYHTLLDRIDYLLCPEQGLLSVVDFYTAGKTPSLHEKGMRIPYAEARKLTLFR